MKLLTSAFLLLLLLHVPAAPARAARLKDLVAIEGVRDGASQRAAKLPEKSPLRAQFGLWHAVSTVLYAIQTAIGLVLVGRRK